MCLTIHRPSINEFKAVVASIPADANGDKWLIGYKNFRFSSARSDPRGCYIYNKSQILTPHQCTRVTEQIMVADKQRGKLIIRDGTDLDNGIHFYKTKLTATRRYVSSSDFTAGVFVKVTDVTGVGICDVVANKIVISDEDWEKYWVANKANMI